jgi:hypothetical protein
MQKVSSGLIEEKSRLGECLIQLKSHFRQQCLDLFDTAKLLGVQLANPIDAI